MSLAKKISIVCGLQVTGLLGIIETYHSIIELVKKY